MQITVRYFASLREALQRDSDVLTTEQTNLTVAQVWVLLQPDTAWPDHLLCAINQEYVQADSLLHDGDELAFFPPVTGG